MFEPETFEDFGEMVTSLRFGRAFVVKAPADKVLRRRLIDFLSGAAAASDADFERVSTDMYALTWGNDPTGLREIVENITRSAQAEDQPHGSDGRSAFGRPVKNS